MPQDYYLNLIASLKSVLGAIELDKTSQLYRDAIAVCDNLENPGFRIAVFGPFNYGKSTLLNALLGKRTLPIDLVPTTGAAIYVRYGEALQSRVTLKDGTVITEEGTKVLQDYATLDERRRMRDDVASVEVYCDHPFLKTGVEFLDLPGTDDREAQDNLARDKLLTADLIVQVLDARQLMTLGEREHLREWLLARGLTTVVFVVNFLNLLEAEEQQEVARRMRFVAETFRSDLPPGVSNLYRVDALPALRARLKGDIAAAKAAGLAEFASALQTIVQVKQEEKSSRLPRVLAIAAQVQQVLHEKIEVVSEALETRQQKEKNRIEIQQRAEKLIQQGLQRSSSEFQSWLYLPNLLSRYQSELAAALQAETASAWERQFKQTVAEYQNAIAEWTKKGCEFFDRADLGKLAIAFPPLPHLAIPDPPASSQPNPQLQTSNNDVPIAIAAGLGWMFGGPVGAVVAGGASYLFNKVTEEPKDSPPEAAEVPEARGEADFDATASICAEAAKDYLTRFSSEAFATLQAYEKQAEQIVCFQPNETVLENTPEYHQLQFLNNLSASLEQELELITD